MLRLGGLRAYLWDQACDYLERWDAGQAAPAERTKRDDTFGAYG